MRSPRATFFHYLARHRLQLVAGVCLAAGSSLAAVVPPRFIGEIIDSLGRAGTRFDEVVGLAGLIVVFAAIEATLRAGARYVMLDASRKAEYRMRNDLFAHLEKALKENRVASAGDIEQVKKRVASLLDEDLAWAEDQPSPVPEDANFRGGARAAVGDVNGDGTPDLLVAAGFGGGPRVAIYNGKTVLQPVAGPADWLCPA